MKVLKPMSEQDEAELRSQRQMDIEAEFDDDIEGGIERADSSAGGSRWQRRVEKAVTHLSAEVAALREQITVGREWRSKKDKSFPVWLKWAVWIATKHLLADFAVLAIVLLYMRRKKDRRLEDLVRAALRVIREYVRKILPSRG